MLQIINSLTGEKTPFKPRQKDHATLYVCGPTVYDRVHLGNARPNVIFDVFFRLLKILYPQVTYVRNITDVDDKIIQRAQERGISIDALTQETIEQFEKDMAALNILSPTAAPRATDHIEKMIEMIQRLLEKGHAYEAEGHVLFDVTTDPDYGHVSKRTLDQMMSGARVEVAPYKKNPTDFVLWKPIKEGEPGWESPWGMGRPGWHIECSAMSHSFLGESFDVHGGGADLMFPHHENEVAQSTCAYGKGTFAAYWMHCGMLTVQGQKMSKSLGNFISMKEALENTPGELIRYALLSTHYRHPLDWTEETLPAARRSLDRFYCALKAAAMEDTIDSETVETPAEMQKALCDDLNTPLALSVLHDYAKQINNASSHTKKQEWAKKLMAGAASLGLFTQTPAQWFQGAERADGNTMTPEEIEKEIQKRRDARAEKDFATADKVRQDLEEQGIMLEDYPTGTTWRWK